MGGGVDEIINCFRMDQFLAELVPSLDPTVGDDVAKLSHLGGGQVGFLACTGADPDRCQRLRLSRRKCSGRLRDLLIIGGQKEDPMLTCSLALHVACTMHTL